MDYFVGIHLPSDNSYIAVIYTANRILRKNEKEFIRKHKAIDLVEVYKYL